MVPATSRSHGLFAFLLFLCSGFGSMAQTSVRVIREDGMALVNSHVTYAGIDGKNGGLILTDQRGTAGIPPEICQGKSRFLIRVDYLGYISQTDTVNCGREKVIIMTKSTFDMDEVVVTGQYSPNNPEKAIQKIKIITKDQMNARGVVNLTDALQYETNMNLSQDNILGSSVSVQGISGQNVKIMIDGVPVVGRQDGNINLSQINMNNVERIEIVEGPLSVNYGSNALAGTINIITKKNQEDKYTLSANSYYESVGQYNADFSSGYHKGRSTLGLSGGRNFFDGWDPRESYSFLPRSKPADSSRSLSWKPREQYFMNAQYTYRIDKNAYRIYNNYFSENILNRGLPREPYRVTAFDETYHTERNILGADLSGDIGKKNKSNWSLIASYTLYQRTRNTYFKDLTNLQESLTANPADHDTSTFRTWMSRSAVRIMPSLKKLHTEVGYDLNHEMATGKRFKDGGQSIGDYALYSTAEWNAREDLTVKPGIRYAYNTAYKTPLIPSLNMKYVRNHTTYRLSYARGFRSPSLKELYFEFVDVNHRIFGNQDLQAESSDNFQLHLTHKRVFGQKILSLESGAFYNMIRNMISLGLTGDNQTYSYINVGQYRTLGVDISASYTANHWKVYSGFVYTGRQSSAGTGDAMSNLYFSPQFRTNITREFKKLGGNAALYFKFNGRLPVYNVNQSNEVTVTYSDAYSMLDLALTKYMLQKKILWTFGAKNLLDVQNIQSAAGSGNVHGSSSNTMPVSWGRSFFTSLKFNINWK